MDSQSREIKHAAARLKALQTMIKNLQTHKMDLEGEVKSWSVTWKAVRLPKKKQIVNLRKSMLILKRQKKNC